MTTQLLRRFTAIACALLLVPFAIGQDKGVKATKKTIRAADGVNIVCDDRGSGSTAIIFLHGWCGDRDYWKHQMQELATDYRVVAVDQAGHGESGKDRKQWTVNSLAGDVESVAKELGLKRVILVGHSMGGPVSLMAAKRMPGTVVAVVGVDTLQNVEFQMPEERKKQFLDGFEADFKTSLEHAIPAMLPEKVDPDLAKWLLTRAEAQDAKMAMGLMRDMMAVDQKSVLKEAHVPVRCINSAGGFAYFTPTAIDINKKLADYNAVLIENVGHYPMLEKPEEFNTKLRSVLKELAVKK